MIRFLTVKGAWESSAPQRIRRKGVAERHEKQEKFIREIKESLDKKLTEAAIKATIKGRHKHLHSVYQKMMEQDLAIDQVYDIMGFRIIVNSVRNGGSSSKRGKFGMPIWFLSSPP